MITLVILHGWGHGSADWGPFTDLISREIPTVALDLPGFGAEPLVNDTWGVPDYAQWVTAKLEAISGDKIILGHSLGGRIASLIASNQLKWLKGLILIGAPCLYRPSVKIRLKIKLAKVINFLRLRKYVAGYYNSDLREADKSGKGKIFRNTVPFDQTTLLPNINVPTLLIWGENDQAAPLRIAREIGTLIPRNTLEIISNAGHNIHLEKLHLLYGIVKNFIKSL